MSDQITICVVGLGYVGLPTALAFHKSGYRIIGIDVKTEIINSLKKGICHLSDTVANLEIPTNSERWNLTSDFGKYIPESDVILITVPTPVSSDRTPDLSLVRSAMKSVLSSNGKKTNQIIVLESTVYPGATNEVVESIKEELQEKFPKDVQFAYSPERVSPGDEGKNAENVAKIVGSNEEDVGRYLAGLYDKITIKGCKYVGPIEVAEAAKMIENTQRDLDIAFVNELAKVLPKMGLDVMDVIEAASTKWNFHKHTPGIGVGGHCIPVDPYYYIQSSKNVGQESVISPKARKINESMPGYCAKIIKKIVKNEGVVFVMGLSYKPNVGDMRESPSMDMIDELHKFNLKIRAWDPLVADSYEMPDYVEIVSDPYPGAMGADMVVLATAHDAFLGIDWDKIGQLVSEKKVFDGPRTLNREKMKSAGFEYSGVGVPDGKHS